MQKIDLRKELRAYYKASPKAPAVVDVPEFSFLMIDGKGDPNTSQDFRQQRACAPSVA